MTKGIGRRFIIFLPKGRLLAWLKSPGKPQP